MLIKQAIPLPVRYIVQAGMLKEGQRVAATVNGTGFSYELAADWTGLQPFLQIRYEHSRAGVQDYTISVEARRSNLGAGQYFYLLCPISGRRCRTLYLAYDSPVFKAREAYHIRLYYPLQLTGGRSRYNAQYFAAEGKIERLQQQRAYLSYKGRQTRYAQRLNTAIEKAGNYDALRFTLGLPPTLWRAVFPDSSARMS